MALSFNSTYYYNQRSDVLEAFLNSDKSLSPYDFALAHYNEFGWKEGSNPNAVFNTNEYLAANTDVADAGVNPFAHYQELGQAEGRAPNATLPALADFNWEVYLASNSDLTEAGITTAAAAYDHFITLGHAENRPGTPAALSFTLADAMAASELPEGYTISDATLTGAQSLADIAAAQAILAGADNATVPELGGDFTVEDTAANILAAEELPVDVGSIRVTDDTLTTAQRDALVELGFDAADLPDLSHDDALEEALAALAAAQKASDDFYDDNAPIADVADLEAAVNKAVLDLATARAVLNETDAELQADLKDAQKEVNSHPGLASAIRAHQARDKALTAAAKADALADAEVSAAGARYEDLNSATLADTLGTNADGTLDGTGDIDDGVGPIIVVNAAGKLVLAAGVSETSNPGVTQLLAAVDAAVKSEISLIAATAAENAAAADVVLYDVGGAAAALATAQLAVDVRAELIQDVADAQALLAQGEALEAALVEATEAVEALGVDNVEVVTSGDYFGTSDADLFVFVGDGSTDEAIYDFSAGDLLFIGKDYTSTTVAAAANLNGNDDFGSLNGLDIFLQQDGANTVVYIELDIYDGHANGAWSGETVTLVGVDASSLTFENGYLRIADTIA